MSRYPRKSAAEKAMTAALAAYRKADPETDKAFTVFQKACDEARERERASSVFTIEGPSEPVRKAYLIAEARALDHIAEVCKDHARRVRGNI